MLPPPERCLVVAPRTRGKVTASTATQPRIQVIAKRGRASTGGSKEAGAVDEDDFYDALPWCWSCKTRRFLGGREADSWRRKREAGRGRATKSWPTTPEKNAQKRNTISQPAAASSFLVFTYLQAGAGRVAHLLLGAIDAGLAAGALAARRLSLATGHCCEVGCLKKQR